MPKIVRILTIPAVLAALLLIPGSAVPRPYPTVIAGLGDSITQATNTCCGPGSYPGRSWSTGDLPADGIRSHYERLAALHPQVSGNNHNYSVNGAKAASLAAQASKAVAQEADYITILIGANDLCASSASAMTSTADFARQIDAALETLHRGLPRARIHVSSIPDLYRLWSVLRSNREARRVWSGSGICPSMLGAGTSEAQRQEVVAREEAFNAILAETCAKYRSCRWDGGAVYRYRFSAGQISTLDYFHPGPAGQAELAELTWQAFNGHHSP
ncbi:SGNH/GDSL hydrolase family protein [Arthrobacter mobilis]|uniref:SGNH/GDSL hydrolase family protein n=1 Tax=Arthrobacter mobilis TaxID=2724944 RepID=A0A7X6K6S0_9MICC|nr:SGNH/GDSL hydrolase family protein [Arthrobacter mobilis]NKX55433.1 SGNH/GDSL hydrolase family protein [Arthrobacter mobilis]